MILDLIPNFSNSRFVDRKSCFSCELIVTDIMVLFFTKELMNEALVVKLEPKAKKENYILYFCS